MPKIEIREANKERQYNPKKQQNTYMGLWYATGRRNNINSHDDNNNRVINHCRSNIKISNAEIEAFLKQVKLQKKKQIKIKQLR